MEGVGGIIDCSYGIYKGGAYNILMGCLKSNVTVDVRRNKVQSSEAIRSGLVLLHFYLICPSQRIWQSHMSKEKIPVLYRTKYIWNNASLSDPLHAIQTSPPHLLTFRTSFCTYILQP
jgi:hypothetical protein